jgi:hypothetical protein
MTQEELKQAIKQAIKEIENEKELDKQVNSFLSNKYVLGFVHSIEELNDEQLINKLKEKNYWEPMNEGEDPTHFKRRMRFEKRQK